MHFGSFNFLFQAACKDANHFHCHSSAVTGQKRSTSLDVCWEWHTAEDKKTRLLPDQRTPDVIGQKVSPPRTRLIAHKGHMGFWAKGGGGGGTTGGKVLNAFFMWHWWIEYLRYAPCLQDCHFLGSICLSLFSGPQTSFFWDSAYWGHMYLCSHCPRMTM